MARLRCYVSSEGENEIRLWHVAQVPAVQAAVIAVLESLQAVPTYRWRRKAFALLHQPICAGLSEVRIGVANPEGLTDGYRIFGFLNGHDSFVMLFPFRKSDDPTYVNSCPSAQVRKLDIQNDPRHSCDCRIPQDFGPGP